MFLPSGCVLTTFLTTYIAGVNRPKSHKNMAFLVRAETFLCFQAGCSSAMRASASDLTVAFLRLAQPLHHQCTLFKGEMGIGNGPLKEGPSQGCDVAKARYTKANWVMKVKERAFPKPKELCNINFKLTRKQHDKILLVTESCDDINGVLLTETLGCHVYSRVSRATHSRPFPLRYLKEVCKMAFDTVHI